MEKTKKYYVDHVNIACQKIAPNNYFGKTANDVQNSMLNLYEMTTKYIGMEHKKDLKYYKSAYEFICTFYSHETNISLDKFKSDIENTYNKNNGLEK